MTGGRAGTTATTRSQRERVPMATKETTTTTQPAWLQARARRATRRSISRSSAIEKQFGKGAIMRLGKDPIDREVHVVPTGSLGLDIALGIGGLPRGRIVEIYGPESSGKTTLTLHVVAEAQKRGGVCAFIDAEHALDVGYAKKLGVKTDELLVCQPDYGEQALEIADMLVRSNAIDVIVIDSVAALTPKAEIEGDMGDAHVGLQARLMSQALRKLTGAISRSRTMVVFINQIRMKIGVMFGSPETTTGGNALKFYASVRLDIRRIGAHQEGRGRDRQPHAGEGREEQAGAAVQGGRVRHPLRPGHLARGRPRRSRVRGEHRRQERRVVLVQRRAHRSGPREREAVPRSITPRSTTRSRPRSSRTTTCAGSASMSSSPWCPRRSARSSRTRTRRRSDRRTPPLPHRGPPRRRRA